MADATALAAPAPAPTPATEQVEALLCWVEGLWQELKISREDQVLFLAAHGLPARPVGAMNAARRVDVHARGPRG